MYPFQRCLRTPFPILYPESCQRPNPCFVDGHVSCYGCLLRQDYLQLASELNCRFAMLARAFYALISASRFTIELYLSCINTSHEWILFYATCHGRPYKQEVHGTSPRGLCLRIETSELHTAMCEHFLLLLNTGAGEHDEEMQIAVNST
jgi:prepilin-type processing-associated H-X9-DG protein